MQTRPKNNTALAQAEYTRLGTGVRGDCECKASRPLPHGPPREPLGAAASPALRRPWLHPGPDRVRRATQRRSPGEPQTSHEDICDARRRLPCVGRVECDTAVGDGLPRRLVCVSTPDPPCAGRPKDDVPMRVVHGVISGERGLPATGAPMPPPTEPSLPRCGRTRWNLAMGRRTGGGRCLRRAAPSTRSSLPVVPPRIPCVVIKSSGRWAISLPARRRGGRGAPQRREEAATK